MSATTIDGKKKSFKEKFKEEFIEYWINVAYLFFYFSVFVIYKRLVLAQYEVDYEQYSTAFFNAFVLGKVVSIGGMMHLGSKINNAPLVLTTLFKSFVFTLWLALFNVIEEFVSGYFKTDTIEGAKEYLVHHIFSYEYLASLLVVFTCFIPFFAFKEMYRVLGHKTVIDLFFKKRESNL